LPVSGDEEDATRIRRERVVDVAGRPVHHDLDRSAVPSGKVEIADLDGDFLQAELRADLGRAEGSDSSPLRSRRCRPWSSSPRPLALPKFEPKIDR